MRLNTAITVLLSLTCTHWMRADMPQSALPLPAGIKVLFSPSDDSAAEVVRLINGASAEILFNQYAITNPDIANALLDAFKRRKVSVAGIIEESPAIRNYQTPAFFNLNGLPVVFSGGDGVDNNRYMVIDRQIVVTGSYDWTLSAQRKNRENMIVITEPSVALAYVNNFRRELSTARLLKGNDASKDPANQPKK